MAEGYSIPAQYVTSSMKTTASVTLTVDRVRLYSMPYTFGSSVAHNEDTYRRFPVGSISMKYSAVFARVRSCGGRVQNSNVRSPSTREPSRLYLPAKL